MSRKKVRRPSYREVVEFGDMDTEKLIDTMFQKFVNSCFASDNSEKDICDTVQIKHAMGIYRQRRKEALLRLLPVVREKCFPPSDKRMDKYLTVSYITYEFYPSFDYNILDAYCDFRLGAVIWILDTLKRAGNLEKAVALLPYFGNKEDYPLLPKNFYHPCYSNALLESMMFMMITRYRSSQEKQLDPALVSENIILEENAEGLEYTAAYQELMSLLPEDAIAEVCDKFRAKAMEGIRIYLKGDYYFKEKAAAYRAYLRKAGKTIKNMIDFKSARFVGPVASPQTGLSLQDFGRIDPSGELGAYMKLAGEDNAFSNLLTDDYLKLTAALSQIEESDRRYLETFGLLFFYDRQELHELFDDKDMEDMFLDYSVDDPLALCFALIYLIDHGDDVPWLFHSCFTVMNEVMFSLPWGLDRDDGEEEKSQIYNIRFSPYEFTQAGWLDRKFAPVQCYTRKGNKMNLAQMFYRLTGCVMPSGIPEPFDTTEAVSALGLTPYETGFVSGAAYSLYLSSQQARLAEETFEGIDDEDTDVVAGDTGTADGKAARKEAAIADLNNKLSESNKSRKEIYTELLKARREIKSLKRTVAEDRKKYAAELVQKEKELNKARLEHRELIDLRELMFSGINNEYSPESSHEDKVTTLPYETKKQVVIFGGHATFIKQMKVYLPTARYVDVDNIAFSPDIVRNADIVWIQTNCISHSQFSNVVKEARNYSVQVRYFAFASAEKSAMQVVEDDLSSKL